MLRSEAFRDIPAAGWRFENAEVMTPQLVKAKDIPKTGMLSAKMEPGCFCSAMWAPENPMRRAALPTP